MSATTPSFDLVVVIPIGPGSRPEWVLDTMASVRYYTEGTLKFVLIDDSQRSVAATVARELCDVDILVIPKNLGKVGGLYLSLAKAYHHVLKNYDCKLVLRMDDDALMTGWNPHLDAVHAMRENPRTAIMGRHITGRFSPDCFGNTHDNYWPRKQLVKDTASWKIIRRPLANLALRSLLLEALTNGYELGENIQGGAYFITRSCLEKLAGRGLLPMSRLKDVNLCEDHLFSLLAKVVDMDLRDLAAPEEPFGIAWKGLPASPGTLLSSGKKIIHSLRFWKDMDEAAIRVHFSRQRAIQPQASS